MRTRLVPYTPFGAKRAPLPDALEAQLVTPMGELPTASVHYHRQGVNAVVLDGVTELAYEHWNGASWVEPPNARFLSMTGNFDHLEETPTRNYSFVGIGWMLRRAKVWEPNGLPVDADGKVQFLSANAGTIMATLIQNAKGRGWGAGIQIDFSPTTDSSGQAWAKVLTIAYDLELDLEAVLSNLYQQGVCDYRWEGRTLRIFNPETTMARDRTTGSNQVRLVVADGQSSAPEDWTNEDLVTDALVLGDEGKSWTFANNASQPLGRLETVITQGGVSDPGTASLLADQDLLKGSATRISYTREFTVTAGSRVRPFQDYQVGDWVWAQRGTSFERLRVMSLSLTVAPEGLRGHAVLGDRLEDLLTKLAKRTKGITGGASAGGNGTRPAPEGPDTRIPSMPSGLVVGVDSYIDDTGWPAGRVELDWAHDGNATNGTAMTIDRFQVFYRINEVGRPWAQLLTTSDTEAAYSPLPVFKADGVTPEQYGFKVRAVGDNAKVSEWTPVVAVTMEDDLTPPPVPEFRAEDLTTWLRTITVRVTGKGAAGETMPRDFSHFNAYQGASASGPWVLTGTKHGDEPGLVYQSQSMPANTTVWFYLTAVDRSGNESAPSAIQSVTPVSNVNLQEITNEIDASAIQIKNAGDVLLESGQKLDEKLAQADTDLESLQGRTSTIEGAQSDMQGDLTRIEGLANTAQSTADGVNTVSPNAPTSADAVGKPPNALWSQVIAGKQVGAWYKSPSTGEWTALPFDPVMIPQINIGTGTFGTMDGIRLGAGTVQADRLSVGASANSITDPGFVSIEISNKRVARSTGTWLRGFADADATNFYQNSTASGTTNWHFYPLDTPVISMAGMIPTEAGTQWALRSEINSDGMAAKFNVVYINRDGTIGYASAGTDTAAGFVRRTIGGSWTAPSTAMGFQPYITFTGTGRAYVYGGASARPKVGTVHIENGAVTADVVNAQSVAGAVGDFVEARVDKLVAGAGTIGTAVIDKLWGDFARFKNVSTDMLRVGNGNLVLDPSFVSSIVRTARLALASQDINPVFTSQSDGLFYMRANSATATSAHRYLFLRTGPVASGQMISVTPGDKFVFECEVWADTGVAWLPQCDILTGTGAANSVNLNATSITGTGTGFQKYIFDLDIPAGTAEVYPRIRFNQGSTGYLRLRSPSFRQKVGSSIIATGSIIAPHIVASEEMWAKVLGAHKIKAGEADLNSFTSDTGFVGAMRTGILTSNVVKTEHLDALAITAKHKITSALYQTTATANRGIKIDANYFRAWNASGNETFRIDASTGDVTANGAVITGSKFQTALVDTGNQWGDKRWMELNEKGLYFYTGQPGFSPAAKFYVNTETNTMEFIGGAFTAGTIYGADIRSELNGSGSGGVIMQPGGLYGYDSSGQRMFTMASANGFVFADKRFGVGTIGGERIIINSANDGNRMGIWFSDTGDGSIGGSNTGGIYIEPNQGDLNLRGQDGLGVVAWQGLTVNSGLTSNARLRVLDTPSTSLAANAHISVGGSTPGTLYLSSSASRFKLDQQILDLPDELLDVPMKDWIDKAEYDDRERLLALGVRDEYQQSVIDTPLRRVPGMVAEDVEATPGGEAFVTRDAEGQTLGLSYERLANARTAVLKRQLDELALRVQALEPAA